MTISILGTEYEFIKCLSKEMEDSDNLGECDRYSKTIKINMEYFMQEYIKGWAIHKTIRHELFHAIFHEAGLDCYSEDEVLVDALAILYPKIKKIIEKGEKGEKKSCHTCAKKHQCWSLNNYCDDYEEGEDEEAQVQQE